MAETEVVTRFMARPSSRDDADLGWVMVGVEDYSVGPVEGE